MRLCVQTLPFEEPIEETLRFLSKYDVESVDWRCEPDEYLDDPDSQESLLETFVEYGIDLEMLGATGYNPLHPDEDRARAADERLRDTIRLADQLGIDTVSAFSGLPGGSSEDRTSNWIVTPVPPGDQSEQHAYQWEEVAIPYWNELGAFADSHGVGVAIEIHVNMLINSPPAMMRLRQETNDRIGAYVDPGHLWLQEIDPVASIRYLGENDAIMHVEASDVQRHESNLRLKGMWDMTPLDQESERPWTFCPVGYGHADEEWREIISALSLVGYDGPVSIQQLNTPEPLHESIANSAEFLDGMLV